VCSTGEPLDDPAPPKRGASLFVFPPTDSNLDRFARLLADGAVVGIPTETVYGLAANALNPEACRKIFSLKGRPLVDPLIVHVRDWAAVSGLARTNEVATRLAKAFWPGPLTLILPKEAAVPDLVTAGRSTVAVRVPRHPVAQKLLRRLDFPLAAPSANPFGYISPTRPEHVAESFGSSLPDILDGGPCEIGLESTIVDLSQANQSIVLRPGAISVQDLSAVVGHPVQIRLPSLGDSETATAPGTYSRHYSPKTPMVLFPEGTVPPAEEEAAVLFLQRPPEHHQKPAVFWLSEDGFPASIGRSLYLLLRQLDEGGYRCLFCELPGKGRPGLFTAIRDRMMRAAGKQ